MEMRMNSRGRGGDYTKDRYKWMRKDAQYSNTWIKSQLQAVMTLRLIAAYNQARLNKKNPGTLKNEELLKIAEIAYPEQYKKNPKLAKTRVFRMLKTKEVKEIADISLVKMLMDKGIDKNYLTDMRQKILNGCMADKKYETALKALQGFEEMHNLMSKATFQSTETREEVDYSKFLANKTVKTIEIEGSGIGEVGGIDEKSAENEEKQAISLKQIKNDAHRSDMGEDNVVGNDNIPPTNKP